MKLIESISEMQSLSRKAKGEGKTLGFVPTMGYLHEGHLSLLRASKSENECSILSIYVNPTQFGPNEDFTKYPRDMEKDLELAESVGVDVVFAPSDKQMYPEGFQTYIQVEKLSEKWEGKTRPGHFRGVCTIVSKLLNIVQPDKLYLGQKDAQQCIILSRMVNELNLPIEVSIQPTIREVDGLAMSSRNTYLNQEERKSALILSNTLMMAKSLIKEGKENPINIIARLKENISREKGARLDYICMVSPETLDEVEEIKYPILVCLAVYIGKTRLIDNLWMRDAL